MIPLFSAEPYYQQLKSLMNGPYEPSITRLEAIKAMHIDNIEEGALGIRFGMSMDEVISTWGKPNRIWVKDSQNIQLNIYRSNFSFDRDELFEISIHAVDAPGFSFAAGKIIMGQTVDLLSAFPGAELVRKTDSIQTIRLESGLQIRVQSSGKRGIIAVAFTRPR